MRLIDDFINYIGGIRRYSPRTLDIYRRALEDFASTLECGADEELPGLFRPALIRSWEVSLLEVKGLSPRTVHLYMSVLSSFSRFLASRELLDGNPVASVKRPRLPSRLPVFYRREAMKAYLESTKIYADGTVLQLYAGSRPLAEGHDVGMKKSYEAVLGRMIVSLLYATGLRRAELISLNISSLDFARATLRVTGKGDKMREIPLPPAICDEISLYLNAVELMVMSGRKPDSPLLVTPSGKRLYPSYVAKAVSKELSGVEGIKGRKSPHVLRHTLATELLEEGTDLNSIKELLGHSSLAATQVYTHNSIAQLKSIYETAHPRAKKGGKDGD